MFFTQGKERAFESLIQQKPGFDGYKTDCSGTDEDCNTCRFYRPKWKYEFCIFEECPYDPGKRTRKPHTSVDKREKSGPNRSSRSRNRSRKKRRRVPAMKKRIWR